LKLYDDGRLKTYLDKPGGKLWQKGIEAMSLMSIGKVDEAGPLFDQFPYPGTRAALRPSAPEGLTPLESNVAFHQLRARSLSERGRLDEAIKSLSDALRLDGDRTAIREQKALLHMINGDIQSALFECDSVLTVHPYSERAWNIRGAIALRQGFPDMAITAFEKSTIGWPSDPNPWMQLGRLYQSAGRNIEAETAQQRLRLLRGNTQ